MLLLILFFKVYATDSVSYTTNKIGNKIIVKGSDATFAYIDLSTCPILTYQFNGNVASYQWRQFCQSVQTTGQSFKNPTTLDVRQLSTEAEELSKDIRYTSYICTKTLSTSYDGLSNCCCESEYINTELSTQGLIAVIVVPIVFFIGGLIMAKLNSHNSRSTWIHLFHEAFIKA